MVTEPNRRQISKETRLTIQLGDELRSQAQGVADRKRLSLAAVVRIALEEWLKTTPW